MDFFDCQKNNSLEILLIWVWRSTPHTPPKYFVLRKTPFRNNIIIYFLPCCPSPFLSESHQDPCSWANTVSCGPPEVNFERWANGKRTGNVCIQAFKSRLRKKTKLKKKATAHQGWNTHIQKRKKTFFQKLISWTSQNTGDLLTPYLSSSELWTNIFPDFGESELKSFKFSKPFFYSNSTDLESIRRVRFHWFCPFAQLPKLRKLWSKEKNVSKGENPQKPSVRLLLI